MKIRAGYVSNSSSSSFIASIKKELFQEFEKDFEKFQNFIKEVFPNFEYEDFYYNILKKQSKKEETIEYIERIEGLKNPSEDMIEFFLKKLEDKNYFDDNGEVEIEFTINSELYDRLGFDYLCQSFIENYTMCKR